MDSTDIYMLMTIIIFCAKSAANCVFQIILSCRKKRCETLANLVHTIVLISVFNNSSLLDYKGKSLHR